MSEEVKFLLVGVLGAVIITGLIIFGTAFHTRQFINGGYCEGSIPGVAGSAWVKCK